MGSQPICERCDRDDLLVVCVDGKLYGPCDAEGCGGFCAPAGDCSCGCHGLIKPQQPAGPTGRLQLRLSPRPDQPYRQDQADELVGCATAVDLHRHRLAGTVADATVGCDGFLTITVEVSP